MADNVNKVGEGGCPRQGRGSRGREGAPRARAEKKRKNMDIFFPPTGKYLQPRPWAARPVFLASGWARGRRGGGASGRNGPGAASPKPRAGEFAPLRTATFVLGSGYRAAAGLQCARAGGAGAGRAAGSGTAPRRPGPLHPGTAELASCRGTTLPRPNEIQARAGGNIVPAGRRLAREAVAAGRTRAGLRGAARGCAGLPAPGGHAPASAGGPGTRRNLPGSLRSWSGRGLGAAAPSRLSSPSPDPPPSLPFGLGGGGSCAPSLPGGPVRPARSRPRGVAQLPGSRGQSERKVLPKLPGWSCRAGPRRSPWNSRATR